MRISLLYVMLSQHACFPLGVLLVMKTFMHRQFVFELVGQLFCREFKEQAGSAKVIVKQFIKIYSTKKLISSYTIQKIVK